MHDSRPSIQSSAYAAHASRSRRKAPGGNMPANLVAKNRQTTGGKDPGREIKCHACKTHYPRVDVLKVQYTASTRALEKQQTSGASVVKNKKRYLCGECVLVLSGRAQGKTAALRRYVAELKKLGVRITILSPGNQHDGPRGDARGRSREDGSDQSGCPTVEVSGEG